jgi:hypothetical protein
MWFYDNKTCFIMAKLGILYRGELFLDHATCQYLAQNYRSYLPLPTPL